MTTATGPQVGATLYAFTNPWLTRKFDLEGLLREVARRGMGPNIEIIGFQSFKEFPDVSDEYAAWFKDLMAEIGLNPVSCAINSDRFLKPGQQPIEAPAQQHGTEEQQGQARHIHAEHGDFTRHGPGLRCHPPQPAPVATADQAMSCG